MNRHQRRADAAKIGIHHAPKLFRRLDQLVQFATFRASLGLNDGRMSNQTMALMRACSHLYSITPETSARLIYTRDIGHHTAGWWKNPDYERCLHLSISFCVNPTDEPMPFHKKMAEVIARSFWSDHVAKAWVEMPYTDEGKRVDVRHYRLFCDPAWNPILPRGEVYSRRNTPADWRSFSEVHGSLDGVDAPFFLNQERRP